MSLAAALARHRERVLFLILGVVTCLAPSPALAQTPTTSGRPILFVHGWCGDADKWATMRNSLAQGLNQSLYQDPQNYDVYFDPTEAVPERQVKRWIGAGVPSVPLVNSGVDGERARFFTIKFVDPSGAFDPLLVATVSVLNKAQELAKVIRAIAMFTRVKDVIVVAHSMGGLVARAYLEGFASPTQCLIEEGEDGYRGGCSPGETPYLSDIAGLMTLDTPHGGASIVDLPGLLSPGCPAIAPSIPWPINSTELRPSGPLIRPLNYSSPLRYVRGAAVESRSAGNIPWTIPIDAVASSSFFQILPYADGVVHKWEQRLNQNLLETHRSLAIRDVENDFLSPVGCALVLPLHRLDCVGAQASTISLVRDFVASRPPGTLPMISVSSRITGSWAGDPAPISYRITGPSGSGPNGPQLLPGVFDLLADHVLPGEYTVEYISGGPSGLGPPKRIWPAATQRIEGSVWSLSFRFEFEASAAPPSQPQTQSPGALPPSPGPLIGTLTPTFAWTRESNADGYGLYVSEEPYGAPHIVCSTEGIPATASSYNGCLLREGGRYRWDMRAHNTNGWSSYSQHRHFTVQTATPANDFDINVAPATQTVAVGSAISFNVSTSLLGGSTQSLNLAATNLPSGATPAFSPNPVTTGGTSTLTITTTPATPAGGYSIQVIAANPAGLTRTKSVHLIVTAAVAGTPAVCTTPSSLGFSDQAVSTTSPSQLVTLRNCGTGTLQVLSIVPDVEFLVGPGSVQPPVSLGAGTATTFSVVFAPQAEGSRSGAVRINTNAPGSPYLVPQSGLAVDAPLTTGRILVNATLNGQPWGGFVGYQLIGPHATAYSSLPQTFPNPQAGSYTLNYSGCGPPGCTFTGITPAATQTLTAGGNLTFTINFTATNAWYLFGSNMANTGWSNYVVAGQPTTFSVATTIASGAAQAIALQAPGLSAGLTHSFSIPVPVAGQASTLTISTAATAPTGAHRFLITGTGPDQITHAAPWFRQPEQPPTTFSVIVTRPPAQPIGRVSVASDGVQANSENGSPGESSPRTSWDGRFVVFNSTASNLVAGDTNGKKDIFLRDEATSSTTRVSVGSADVQSNGWSSYPAISGDGRLIAFQSNATNLTPGETLGSYQVYVREIDNNRTSLVSVASDGSPAQWPNGALSFSGSPSLSHDGRYVAFESAAPNLTLGDTNNKSDVFVHDRRTGETSRVSVAGDGSEGNGDSKVPAISADGRYVAFLSSATNLTADLVTPGSFNVFVHDRLTGETNLVSKTRSGAADGLLQGPGVGANSRMAMSADGRFVAYASEIDADSLTEDCAYDPEHQRGCDVFATHDVFVRDLQRHQTQLVSSFSTGGVLGDSDSPAISGDGRFVTFRSNNQVWLRDLLLGRTEVLSVASNGSPGDSPSGSSAIAGNGSSVAFSSSASNLVADSNGVNDVFVAANPGVSTTYITSLAISPRVVAGGSTLQGTMTLSAAAPAGDALVSVTSNHDGIQVPAVVRVPAGSVSATFVVTTLPAIKRSTGTLIASFGGTSALAVADIEPPTVASITARTREIQSASIGSPFGAPLEALVLDSTNQPMSGVPVTFFAPASGPSGDFPDNTTIATSTSGVDGVAAAPDLTANSSQGEYVVTASVAGVPEPAVFALSNVLLTTATGLGSSPNPAVFGEDITLIATTTSNGGSPAGTVTLKKGNETLGVAILDGGIGTVTVSGLTVGSHSIVAQYAGDASFAASASPALTQVVSPSLPTLAPSAFSNVTPTTADLSGGVGSDGGAPITERGFVYSIQTTNPSPVIGGPGVTRVVVSGTTGPFSATVSPLTAASQHAFKAFATNDAGTSYTAVNTFTTSAMPATQIAVGAGDNQAAVAGSAVTILPSVIVRDANYSPVSNVPVVFAVAGGGGSVTGESQVTDASGVATVGSWTLGVTAGTSNNTLTATSPGLAGSPLTFTASASAGPATQVSANAGDNQTAAAGNAVAILPSVIVRDVHNNPVSDVPIVFAVASGGGSVTGESQMTNASGIAVVGSWTLGATAATNNNALTATSTGLAGSPVTFVASGVPGPATQIAVSGGNNQVAPVGVSVAIAPSAVVRDAYNNAVSGAAVTFAVTAGGGSVTGEAPTTDASGVATVGAWTLGTAAGTNNNTLTATSPGLTGSPLTFTASASAGPATQIALSAGNNQVAAAGSTVTLSPSVLVRDAHDNPVSNVPVLFAVAGGGGSVTEENQLTSVSGIAVVGSWTLGSTAGSNNNAMTATSAGLTGSPVTFVASGTTSISIGDAAIAEGNAGMANAVFTISLSAPSEQTVTVAASTSNGSAQSGSDYTATGPVTVTFVPGATAQSFSVPVHGDVVSESTETFFVTLTSPANAAILDGVGSGAIGNDDAAPPARVFVSSSGSDLNVCSAQAAPCRSLAAALDQVAIDGEVIILTAGEYESAPLSITRGVKVTSPMGTVAFVGQPITVNAPEGRVVLRGLTLKGSGAGTALTLTAADSLSIEDTTVDRWSIGLSLTSASAAQVFVSNAVFRSNGTGVQDAAGAGVNRVSIEDSRFEGNGKGVEVLSRAFTVRETAFVGNSGSGVVAGPGSVSIQRSEFSLNTIGVSALSGGAVRIGRSRLTANVIGLSAAIGSTVESSGTNVIRGNGLDIDGAITTPPEG